MNILLLSAGTRNKIVQYFKRTEGTRVVATDMQLAAPAIYEADAYYIVPRISEPGYLDIILDICRKEKIDGVLSLIDPELSLLAQNVERFKEAGVTVIGSDYGLCERALDKMQMYRWLSGHGYSCAKSYVDKEAFLEDYKQGLIAFPVYVKPVRGSASIGISQVRDLTTLDLLFEHYDGLMIQEFLRGQEIGADVYIDMLTHEVVSIFTKKKLLMRAGETDKSVSFKDEKLFDLIKRFCKESGCNRVNVAWYKGSAANPNDWQLLVNVLNHATEVCAKEGIFVAYHNHDHEFSMKIGRRSVWEWLWTKGCGDDLRQITPTPRFSDRVLQELDCGNCVLGGGDPVACLAAHPRRNPTVHVMPAISDTKGLKPGEAGVGSAHDKADWKRIIPALAADGVEWLVVKPTTHPDSLADLEASIKYLKGIMR